MLVRSRFTMVPIRRLGTRRKFPFDQLERRQRRLTCAVFQYLVDSFMRLRLERRILVVSHGMKVITRMVSIQKIMPRAAVPLHDRSLHFSLSMRSSAEPLCVLHVLPEAEIRSDLRDLRVLNHALERQAHCWVAPFGSLMAKATASRGAGLKVPACQKPMAATWKLRLVPLRTVSTATMGPTRATSLSRTVAPQCMWAHADWSESSCL